MNCMSSPGDPSEDFAGDNPKTDGARATIHQVYPFASEVSSLSSLGCNEKADDAEVVQKKDNSLQAALKSIKSMREDLSEQGTRPSSIQLFLRKTTDTLDDRKLPWRRKVWILMEDPSNHRIALKVHYLYSLLIILSVLSTVVQTIETLSEEWQSLIFRGELFFNTLFTLEVVVRLVCTPRKAALLRNMYMWMDIGAVVCFYVVLIFDIAHTNMYFELTGLLIPILRLLKITRHSVGWRILMQSVRECAEPLSVPAFLLLLMTVVASCVIFWLEKHFAPSEDRMVFDSIPHAMWFVIATISTVGYGDVTPKAPAAKTAAAVLIVGGVCYMAMPLAIIGGTFVNVYSERDRLLLRERTLKRFAEGNVTPDDLRALFEAADQDNSGAVKRSEFVELVEAFQLGMTRLQIIKLFQSVDANGSGEITFDEFAFFLFPELDIPDHNMEDLEDEGEAKSPARSAQGKSPRSSGLGTAGDLRLLRRSSLEGQELARRRGHSETQDPPLSVAWCGDSPRHRSRFVGHRHHSAGDGISPRARASFCLDEGGQQPSNGALLERVERLEAAVARLGADQKKHFEAQQHLLEQLASKLSLDTPSGSQHLPTRPTLKHTLSTRLPSCDDIPENGHTQAEALPGHVLARPSRSAVDGAAAE